MDDRDQRGRFPKGVSGNPGGRAPMPEEIRQIFEAAVPHAARTLVRLIDAEDPKVGITACNIILDRLYGKPAQQINADVKSTSIGEAHIRALQEINERRRQRLLELPPETAAN